MLAFLVPKHGTPEVAIIFNTIKTVLLRLIKASSGHLKRDHSPIVSQFYPISTAGKCAPSPPAPVASRIVVVGNPKHQLGALGHRRGDVSRLDRQTGGGGGREDSSAVWSAGPGPGRDPGAWRRLEITRDAEGWRLDLLERRVTPEGGVADGPHLRLRLPDAAVARDRGAQ